MCIVGARDEFDLDDKGTVHFMETVQRYIGYEADGLVDLKDFSESLMHSTGIDLRISRWVSK